MEIKLENLVNAQIKLGANFDEWEISAVVNIDSAKNVNSISDGQVSKEGGQVATFNWWSGMNLTLNFNIEDDNKQEVLEVVQKYIASVKEQVQDLAILSEVEIESAD